MADPAPHLSVVIPCYDEELRIGATLATLARYFERQDYTVETLVVDDGSRDGTSDLVSSNYPGVRLISYRPNRGKGYAVKTGMLEATGKHRLFYDADASTPIEELEKIWPQFEAGADIVIGSRALPQSDVQVHQPWYRENMGRTYNLLLRALGLTQFHDTQCGFKIFTAASCESVFPQTTRDGFGVDCEILYIARRHGFEVVEMPVRWENSPATRVNAITDSLDMIRESLIVRLKAFRGHYNRP